MKKLTAAKKKAIKTRFKRAGLVNEVNDDGSVFYYENSGHKTRLSDRKKARSK